MFTVRKEIEFDAGHRVPYHGSKCRHLHGHRWKVVAHVEAAKLVESDSQRPDSSMVIDYGDIKKILTEKVHDVFDHRFIMWEQDALLPAMRIGDINDIVASSLVIVPVIPTSEALAEYIFGLIVGEFRPPMRLAKLDLYETPTSMATFEVDRNADITYWNQHAEGAANG